MTAPKGRFRHPDVDLAIELLRPFFTVCSVWVDKDTDEVLGIAFGTEEYIDHCSRFEPVEEDKS